MIEDDIRDEKRPMASVDKVFMTLVCILFATLFIGILYGLRAFAGTFIDVKDAVDAGMGFRNAFFVSFGLSFFFMIIFSLFAGDGFAGELGIMLGGYFVMLVFFTVSIAVIL